MSDGGLRIEIAALELAFACAPGDTLLRAALRAGVGAPYSCNMGACGECKLQVLAGDIARYPRDCPALTERDVQRGRHLACQAVPLSDCKVALHPEGRFAPLHVPRLGEAVLVQRQDLAEGMARFTFRTAWPAAFRAGQYVLLKPAGAEVWRPYSMANLPNAQGDWDLIVRHADGGTVSGHLFNAAGIGDSLGFDGPYGLAYYRPGSSQAVAIGGGSGIGVVLAIAKAAAADPACQRLNVIYGGRTPGDLWCEAELLRDAQGLQPPRLRGVVSSPEHPASAGWAGAVGMVHEHLAAELAELAPDASVYVAGPAAMVEAVEATLTGELQVGRERIHYDRFF